MQIKSLDEVINRLQYKADNIKAKLESSYFTECIDYLKSLNGDLISKSALIKALTNVEVSFYLEDGQTSDTYDGTTIMDIIEEQPTVSVDVGWIPVEERYPDTDTYILLSLSNFSIPIVGRWEEDEDGGAFYAGDEDETLVSQDLFVNAWMPLVKPYRPEGE